MGALGRAQRGCARAATSRRTGSDSLLEARDELLRNQGGISRQGALLPLPNQTGSVENATKRTACKGTVPPGSRVFCSDSADDDDRRC